MSEEQVEQQNMMKVTTVRPEGYACRGKPMKLTFIKKVQLYLMGYRFGGYLGIYKKR